MIQVRRAGWFFQEGSILKPCSESLATQIEEGYIKLKPFRTQATTTTNVPSTTLEQSAAPTGPPLSSPKVKHEDSESENKSASQRSSSPFRFSRGTSSTTIEIAKKEMIWKLLGDLHMGKYVVYTNATTAWLLSDDLYGKLTSSVYQTLSAGVHLGGNKLIRGYIETSKSNVQDKEVSASATVAKRRRRKCNTIMMIVRRRILRGTIFEHHI